MAALKQRSERTWSAGEALFSRMCGAEVAIHGSEGDRRGIVDMMTTKSERANIRILIVDDFSSIRKIVRKLLASLGFMHVAEARDASEAVRRLQHDSFDLIISDWNMPTMTGKQLLEFVRSQERLQKIPFIMLTMQTDKESVLSAKEAGVSHYLAKPFTAGELEKKLSEVFTFEGSEMR